jgi:hypothetical protein
MNQSEKIIVAFNGGSYGSYLLWLLWTLTTDNDIVAPFIKEKSNSHKFYEQAKGNVLKLNPADLLSEKINSDAKFIMVHPKISAEHNVADSIDKLVNIFGKTVLVYPTPDTYLLNINNCFTKVYDSFWEGLLNTIDIKDIYNNYPDIDNIPPEQLPLWLVREYLSFNIFDSWEAEVDWYLPDYYNNKQVYIVKIEDILYNVKDTLTKIKEFYKLEWTKPIDSIMPYHTTNISLQKNLTQDQLCKQILESFFSNISFTWNNNDLTLISEAYIQKQLRDNGYELKCHNLNVFPISTTELKEKSYKQQEKNYEHES